jgi:hypothetical protein
MLPNETKIHKINFGFLLFIDSFSTAAVETGDGLKQSLVAFHVASLMISL